MWLSEEFVNLAVLKQHESPAVREQYVISLQKGTNQKPLKKQKAKQISV